MTASQLLEIRKFLQSKRLPIDILMEVEDHFVTQIHDLVKEGISFPEAFSRVQTNWLSDLKLIYDVGYSLDDIAVITKNIIRNNRKILLKKALIFTSFAVLFLIFSKFFLAEKQFFWLLSVVVFGSVLFPVARFITKWKTFTLPRKYSNFLLSIYQQNNALSIFGFPILVSWISHFEEISSATYHLFFSEKIGLQIISLLWISVILFANLYCYLNQNQYLKSIEGVKSHLVKSQIA